MGILSDLFKGRQVPAGKPGPGVEERAEIDYVRPVAPEDASTDGVEYAEPDDYDSPPVLTLKPWDYGQGLEETTAGYGFETPDGKTWPAGKCHWTTWEELGVLVINVVGEKYHLDDLADPSFDPGRPLRLVPEPDNPHDRSGNAISIRNLGEDRTAGYVKSGSAARLRNMLRQRDIRVMALSCRFDQSQVV